MIQRKPYKEEKGPTTKYYSKPLICVEPNNIQLHKGSCINTVYKGYINGKYFDRWYNRAEMECAVWSIIKAFEALKHEEHETQNKDCTDPMEQRY